MDEGKVTDSWPLHRLWSKDKFLSCKLKQNWTFCVCVFWRCTFLSSADNCSSADGTKSIWLVQLQWRIIAEHFKLIKISMLNVRFCCWNRRERNVPHCYTEKIIAELMEILFVATVAPIDQNAFRLISLLRQIFMSIHNSDWMQQVNAANLKVFKDIVFFVSILFTWTAFNITNIHQLIMVKEWGLCLYYYYYNHPVKVKNAIKRTMRV